MRRTKKIREAEANEFLNKLCAAHGLNRTQWSNGNWATTGLRGAHASLVCDLMSALRIVAVTGRMPELRR